MTSQTFVARNPLNPNREIPEYIFHQGYIFIHSTRVRDRENYCCDTQTGEDHQGVAFVACNANVWIGLAGLPLHPPPIHLQTCTQSHNMNRAQQQVDARIQANLQNYPNHPQQMLDERITLQQMVQQNAQIKSLTVRKVAESESTVTVGWLANDGRTDVIMEYPLPPNLATRSEIIKHYVQKNRIVYKCLVTQGAAFFSM